MNKVSELIGAGGHEVYGIQKDASIAEAAVAFLENGVSSLLVYDGAVVSGIFTKNDLVRCCSKQGLKLGDHPVAASMSTDLFSVLPDADIEEVFAEMIGKNLHHAPVIDGGEAIGMLTPIDILLYQKDLMNFENQELIRYIAGSY